MKHILAVLALFAAFTFFSAANTTVLAQENDTRTGEAQITNAQFVVVNSASYLYDAENPQCAPGMLGTIFGTRLTNSIGTATTQPLPTELAGVQVRFKKSDGSPLPAQLLYVSPQQINFLVPDEVVTGRVTTIEIYAPAANRFTYADVRVAAVEGGVFSANSTGQGLPAAVTTFDGINYDAILYNTRIDVGTQARPNYLILFATGVRNARQVQVRIAGIPCQVDFHGAQGGFAGLDQINVRLPQALAGAGGGNFVPVEVLADGVLLNLTQIRLR